MEINPKYFVLYNYTFIEDSDYIKIILFWDTYGNYIIMNTLNYIPYKFSCKRNVKVTFSIIRDSRCLMLRMGKEIVVLSILHNENRDLKDISNITFDRYNTNKNIFMVCENVDNKISIYDINLHKVSDFILTDYSAITLTTLSRMQVSEMQGYFIFSKWGSQRYCPYREFGSTRKLNIIKNNGVNITTFSHLLNIVNRIEHGKRKGI